MPDDKVGLGEAPTKVSQFLTGEIRELRDILKTAEGTIGDELLTDFEEQFVVSNLKLIARDGMAYDYSTSRKEMVAQIRRRLKKEGII